MASNENYEIPESGAVFTFGRSGFADNQQSHFFIRNDPVIEISCGDEHTAVVCTNGRVFLFGQNDYGQLGLGHTRSVTKPSCLKYLKPFHATHVACGKGHTIVSTKCRRLFSFGSNSDGQLGTGDLSDKIKPQLINTKHFGEGSISAVSAGCFHSACLLDNGELYMWGSNSEGQCGTEVDTNLLIPTKIQFENSIITVSCGYYHTAFVSDGNLYTFGEEDSGKLGYRKANNKNLPQKVELEFLCTQVVCGGNHTLILSDEKRVFGCGSNFSGQLGITKNSAESYSPIGLDFSEDTEIVLMSAGESHSAFITENGKLYMCGDGRYGKTCSEDHSAIFSSPTLITLFSNFQCVSASCGGCQTMILAKPNSEGVNSGKVENEQDGNSVNLKEILFSDNAISSNNILSLPPLKVKKTLNDPLGISNNESENYNLQDPSDEIVETNTNENNTEEDASQLNQKDANQYDDVYVDIQGIYDDKIDNVKQSEMIENIQDAKVNDSSIAATDGGAILKTDGTVKKLFNVFKGKKSSGERIATANYQDDSAANERTDRNSKTGSQHRSRACTII